MGQIPNSGYFSFREEQTINSSDHMTQLNSNIQIITLQLLADYDVEVSIILWGCQVDFARDPICISMIAKSHLQLYLRVSLKVGFASFRAAQTLWSWIVNVRHLKVTANSSRDETMKGSTLKLCIGALFLLVSHIQHGINTRNIPRRYSDTLKLIIVTVGKDIT